MNHYHARCKQAYGAGPITETKYKDGLPVQVIEHPAPTLDSVKEKFAKRGPKPGVKRANPDKYRWADIDLTKEES